MLHLPAEIFFTDLYSVQWLVYTHDIKVAVVSHFLHCTNWFENHHVVSDLFDAVLCPYIVNITPILYREWTPPWMNFFEFKLQSTVSTCSRAFVTELAGSVVRIPLKKEYNTSYGYVAFL